MSQGFSNWLLHDDFQTQILLNQLADLQSRVSTSEHDVHDLLFMSFHACHTLDIDKYCTIFGSGPNAGASSQRIKERGTNPNSMSKFDSNNDLIIISCHKLLNILSDRLKNSYPVYMHL